jgi:hypothetical protein
MAYDTLHHVTLLFGGRGPPAAGGADIDHGDLWQWDGASWSRLASEASGPAARNASAGGYDAARERLVVFGGRTGTGFGPVFADTWEWEGTNWTLVLAQQNGLNGRVHPAGGYDPVRELVTIASGFDPAAGDDLHDQWDWDGAAWTLVSGSVPGTGFAPVIVGTAGGTYLLQSRTSDRRVDVLRSNGAGQWTAVTPSGPAPRATSYAVAELPAGGFLLFGGSSGTGVLANTWTFDGSDWTRLTVSGPPGRVGAAMALDPTRGMVVLFGGENWSRTLEDTWEFDGGTWEQVGESRRRRR